VRKNARDSPSSHPKSSAGSAVNLIFERSALIGVLSTGFAAGSETFDVTAEEEEGAAGVAGVDGAAGAEGAEVVGAAGVAGLVGAAGVEGADGAEGMLALQPETRTAAANIGSSMPYRMRFPFSTEGRSITRDGL
jgi:hypothetical protein